MPHRFHEINKRQKEYYESRFEANGGEEREANLITNAWTKLRRRIQKNDDYIGRNELILAEHREWLGDLSNSRVLDLGCFSGNALSLWIASRCREYTGLDLSEKAIAQLNSTLGQQNLTNAVALAGDFLENDFPQESFDVVYAHSVLHHFPDTNRLCQELHRVLAPGGIIVSYDPLNTEPINKVARTLYRPFQSDKDWEWPFTRRTFDILEQYFRIAKLQGDRSFSLLSLPVALVPWMQGAAYTIGRFGLRLERRLARQKGLFLWSCWLVSAKLVKDG